jgi:hypothetical protein
MAKTKPNTISSRIDLIRKILTQVINRMEQRVVEQLVARAEEARLADIPCPVHVTNERDEWRKRVETASVVFLDALKGGCMSRREGIATAVGICFANSTCGGLGTEVIRVLRQAGIDA